MDRYDERLESLRALGFSESKCIAALNSAKGRVDIAADILLGDKSIHASSVKNLRGGSRDVLDKSPLELQIKASSVGRDERLEMHGNRTTRYERDSERVSLPRESNQHQSVKLRGPSSYLSGSRKSARTSSNRAGNSNSYVDLDGPSLEPEIHSEHLRSTEQGYARSLRERKAADRAQSMPAIGLEEIQFYKPHISLEAARRLKVGDYIDHRDDVGKSLGSCIRGINPENGKFIIHYEGWADKWDTESDPIKELWRFSKYRTLSQRQVYRKDLQYLQEGDMIDIYPRNHPGWKGGTIRRLDINKKTRKRTSGQVQVQYKAEDIKARSKNLKPKLKDYLYWVHLDNLDEVAPFPTKSLAINSEAIVNTYQNNQWLEVKIRQTWEPAHVVEVRGNYITVQCERLTSKVTVTLHCVRDKERIRDLGGAIPESEVEKLKREELVMAKEKLKSVGNVLVEMEEDGNCLYRAWAFQIYGDAEKYHMLVRKECCQYIEDNKAYFLHFIPEFAIEMAKKRKNGEWGDQIDIIAMSELYNVPVKIFQLNFEAKALTQTSFGIDELRAKGITSLPQLKLCRHRETHYNAVVDTNTTVPFTNVSRKGSHIRKIREELESLRNKKSQDSEDEKDVEAKEDIGGMRNLSHSRRGSYSPRSYPPRFSAIKVVTPGRNQQKSNRDRNIEIPSNISLDESIKKISF